MAVAFSMWDWEWEWELSKQRGYLKYERYTHFRKLLLKQSGFAEDSKTRVQEECAVNSRPSLDHGCKYKRRGKNARGEQNQDGDFRNEYLGFYQRVCAEKKDEASRGKLVFIPFKRKEIIWGRKGREGIKGHSEYIEDPTMSDEDDEDSDEEDDVCPRQWPEPVKHKGGSPYNKPLSHSARQLFLDKRVTTKKMKREDWRQEILENENKLFYKEIGLKDEYQKLVLIDSKANNVVIKSVKKQGKRNLKFRPDAGYIENVREQRFKLREANKNLEFVPPFVGDSPKTDEDFFAQTTVYIETGSHVKSNTEVVSSTAQCSPASKTTEEVGKISTGNREGDGILCIKLSRESTRPDILHTEFRHDYREAGCKPRRFVLNVSRIVIHHVTLMNRLRLRAIPKLDFTTYLVFSYCKEFAPGVDLYRFWIASTWTRSRKDVLVTFNSIRENLVQIQELIQCVVSALDNVDLRRLVSKTERRNKKNLQANYRPVCNFSMLHSVMKWEVATSCVPRATEWFSCNDSEDTPGDLHNLNSLKNLLEAKRTTTNNSALKHGPSDPDLCGACLVDTNTDAGNKLLALDACSHWFCEQCWKSRLLRQLKKADPARDGIARCVELGCDNPLDSVTLLTLLSVEKIRSMVESKIRGRVASLAPHVVMCPNASCRQVFTITRGDHTPKSDNAIPVVCICSCQFCSNCLDSPHWPASCDLSARYNEIIFQRGDNSMLLRMLLGNEFPEDLLSGRKCFNCGRFVRQFVFRKTEPNEFGRPLCLQCAKEDHQNNNVSLNSVANSNHVSQANNANFRISQTITKWYKIATAHRKMRHPEVVKALYAMADTVANKLVCAVTAGKYVGDSKRAATEWDDSIFDWAEENYRTLCKAQSDTSTEDSGVNSSDKHESFESKEASSRATSASSRYSTSSLAHYTEHALSDTSVTATRLSAPLGFDKSEVCLEMTRAAYNIVQLKLELHQIAEYLAVLLDYQVALRGKLIRCLERAEDLCSSLGILLHDPHVHNAGRILPTFTRLRVQALHAIENIQREITNSFLGFVKVNNE